MPTDHEVDTGYAARPAADVAAFTATAPMERMYVFAEKEMALRDKAMETSDAASRQLLLEQADRVAEMRDSIAAVAMAPAVEHGRSGTGVEGAHFLTDVRAPCPVPPAPRPQPEPAPAPAHNRPRKCGHTLCPSAPDDTIRFGRLCTVCAPYGGWVDSCPGCVEESLAPAQDLGTHPTHLAADLPVAAPVIDADGALCPCGLPVAVRTATKPNGNYGRVFHRCPLPKLRQCDFFEWADGEPDMSHLAKGSVHRPAEQHADRGRMRNVITATVTVATAPIRGACHPSCAPHACICEHNGNPGASAEPQQFNLTELPKRQMSSS